MRRVAVVGSGGAGKSTFARELGRRTGIPVIHLDQHFWKPGWVATPAEEWRAVQNDLLAADSWIVDGNRRLGAAETVARGDGGAADADGDGLPADTDDTVLVAAAGVDAAEVDTLGVDAAGVDTAETVPAVSAVVLFRRRRGERATCSEQHDRHCQYRSGPAPG